MDELNEQQLTKLNVNVQEGHIIRAWCQHPGYALYRKKLDEVLADKKNAWLKGSDEEAKLERIRAQGLQKAYDILTQFLMLGDNAARILNSEAVKQPE